MSCSDCSYCAILMQISCIININEISQGINRHIILSKNFSPLLSYLEPKLQPVDADKKKFEINEGNCSASLIIENCPAF